MSTIILIYILHIYYSLKYALFNTGIRETAFIYTYTKFARSTFYNRIPYSIEEPKELYAIIYFIILYDLYNINTYSNIAAILLLFY